MAALFGAAGCDNGTTPPSDPKCECPNGTIHIVTDDENYACCDEVDCNCTAEKKTRALECGISLDNQSDASISANISKVNGAAASVNARLVSRIKELSGAKIIVKSGDGAGFEREEDAVKISIGSLNTKSKAKFLDKNLSNG